MATGSAATSRWKCLAPWSRCSVAARSPNGLQTDYRCRIGTWGRLRTSNDVDQLIRRAAPITRKAFFGSGTCVHTRPELRLRSNGESTFAAERRQYGSFRPFKRSEANARFVPTDDIASPRQVSAAGVNMAYQPTSSFGGNRDPLIRVILRQYRRSELTTDNSSYSRFSPITDFRGSTENAFASTQFGSSSELRVLA